MIEKIKFAAALLRDVGLLVGLPAVLYVAGQLYSLQQQGTAAQIASLKEQIEILKERQYERASAVLKAQKEASEFELEAIGRSIKVINNSDLDLKGGQNRLLCLDLKRKAEAHPPVVVKR
jgi:hypothetical protein